MPNRKIAVIGECMIELSQKGAEVCRSFGGDTLNTAVYLARQLGASDMEVHYVTALGEDNFSQQMLDAWHEENVHTTLTQRLANRLPGLYYIETDAQGERTFSYWRNEAAARFWLESEQAETLCAALAQFDYLYLSGISLAILSAASREKLMILLGKARANGCNVIFDNNYRPRLWASKEETQRVYQQMLGYTDIAFLTLDDEDLLWGEKPVEEVIARTQAAGVKEVVIKRGAESCLVARQGEALLEVPAVKLAKEKVIDTTAAGDSFSAGYLAVRLTGGSAETAANRGHLTASTVIQYRGAIIPKAAMPV